MNEVIIKEVDGFDIVQYQPKGVCSKMMQIRIKDEIVHDVEFVGGCAGNLIGIGALVKGQKISDIVGKLQGIPCGSRTCGRSYEGQSCQRRSGSETVPPADACRRNSHR